MTFRDDLGAAQARADALARRVDQLERENAALRRGDELELTTTGDADDAPDRLRTSLGLMMILPAIILSVLGGLALAFELPILGGPLLVLAALLFVANGLLLKVVEVAGPGWRLIVSGRPRRLPDGTTVPYRVTGGRVVRVPLLERAERLDVRPRPIRGRVTGAFARTGERIDLELVATIRLAGSEPLIHRAIERFLGQDRSAVAAVALQTIEGCARGAVSALTADEVRDRTRLLAEKVLDEAAHRLAELGIEIDALELAPAPTVSSD